MDPSSALPDGRAFRDVREFQTLLAADPDRLMKNLAVQFAVYSTGRPAAFGDRLQIAAAARANGIRELLHAVVQGELFRTK